MSDQTKRIILAIGFVLIVLIIAFLLYWIFFRPIIAPPTPPALQPNLNVEPDTGLPAIPPSVNIPPTTPIEPTTPLAPGIPDIPTVPTIPTVPGPTIDFQANGGPTSYQTLETNPTITPTLANNGRDLIYYDSTTGYIQQITPDGEKKLFSGQIFKNVENITWAPNNQKAVLEYPDGSNIIYDFNQNRSITLPEQWKDFVFSNNSEQIAFKDIKLDKEDRHIAVSTTNKTGYRLIEPIGEKDKDVYMTWSPDNNYVALYREGLDEDRSLIYPIGFNKENYRVIKVEGRDIRFEWAPSGRKMIYSAFNSRSDYNPALWVVNTSPDALGTGRKPLGLNTWADKCTYSAENTIYCAVPRELETGTGFLPSLADNTPDDIYRVDLQTGTTELIAEPLFDTSIEELIISEDGKYLYWLEKNSGQIKKINL